MHGYTVGFSGARAAGARGGKSLHCGYYASSGGYQEFGSIIDFFSKYLLNNLPWVRRPSKGFNSFIHLIFFKILVCATQREGCFIYVLMGFADIRCFSWPLTHSANFY